MRELTYTQALSKSLPKFEGRWHYNDTELYKMWLDSDRNVYYLPIEQEVSWHMNQKISVEIGDLIDDWLVNSVLSSETARALKMCKILLPFESDTIKSLLLESHTTGALPKVKYWKQSLRLCLEAAGINTDSQENLHLMIAQAKVYSKIMCREDLYEVIEDHISSLKLTNSL